MVVDVVGIVGGVVVVVLVGMVLVGTVDVGPGGPVADPAGRLDAHGYAVATADQGERLL